MQSSAKSGSPIRFGVFELDLRNRELRKRGVKVKLQQQPLDLLHILLERRPEVVTREEIRERLWPAGVHVDFDRSLNKAVVKLRDALGDDAESPRFVETLPRYGYRFIAPVERGQGPPELVEGPAASMQAPSLPAVDPSTLETGDSEGPSAIGRGPAVTELPPDAPQLYAASNDVATPPPPGSARRMWMARAAWTAFLILAATGTWWLWRERAGSVKPLQALAVLPLDNLSDDPEQQYFADGMTESLITELGQISPLRIISHTSVKGYQGTKKSIAEIARDLQVDAVIEGTVARSGDHLRVTANLIQVSPERHLWAGSYDRNVRDMLALEKELASSIVTEVQGKLTPLQQARLSRNHPINPDAEIALAKAAYFKNNQRTPEGAREAVAYSQQAVKIDPGSAPAYAALSESYALTIFMTAEKRSEVLSLAKAAAERALALDGQLEAAHAAEAEISCAFEWDWPRCEQEVRRALELNPNDAGARETLANYLAAIGRTDEAVAEAKRARANNPLSILANRDVGRHLYFAGKYDEAIAELNRTAELDPKSHIIFSWIGFASIEKGIADQYVAMLVRQQLNDGSSAEAVRPLQAAYAAGGLKGYWSVALAAALRNRQKLGHGAEYSLAVLNAHLGNKDQAFEWLEEGYRQRSYSLTWIKVDPQLANLRPDARFDVLLVRIGLR